MEEIGQFGVNPQFEPVGSNFGSCLICQFLQVTCVDFGEVGKSWTETNIVSSTERVDSHHIQMIGDQHQAAGSHFSIEAARSVRQDHVLHAHSPKHTDREHYLIHRIAFVVMKASLLNGYVLAADLAKYELPCVALYRRLYKMGDVGIGNSYGILELICERAQSTSKNNRCLDRLR